MSATGLRIVDCLLDLWRPLVAANQLNISYPPLLLTHYCPIYREEARGLFPVSNRSQQLVLLVFFVPAPLRQRVVDPGCGVVRFLLIDFKINLLIFACDLDKLVLAYFHQGIEPALPPLVERLDVFEL